MDKKICTKCKEEKSLAEFYVKSDRRKGSSYCKTCFNRYCSERWVAKKIKAIEYKGSKCERCSLAFPEVPYCVFDFHHLDQKTKDVDWSKLRRRSWDKIVLELNKCQLLCANCHRITHHLSN